MRLSKLYFVFTPLSVLGKLVARLVIAAFRILQNISRMQMQYPVSTCVQQILPMQRRQFRFRRRAEFYPPPAQLIIVRLIVVMLVHLDVHILESW